MPCTGAYDYLQCKPSTPLSVLITPTSRPSCPFKRLVDHNLGYTEEKISLGILGAPSSLGMLGVSLGMLGLALAYLARLPLLQIATVQPHLASLTLFLCQSTFKEPHLHAICEALLCGTSTLLQCILVSGSQ